MAMETVCADCGINVPWDLQFAVPSDEGGTKIVCEECCKQYGYNLDGEVKDPNWGNGARNGRTC